MMDWERVRDDIRKMYETRCAAECTMTVEEAWAEWESLSEEERAEATPETSEWLRRARILSITEMEAIRNEYRRNPPKVNIIPDFDASTTELMGLCLALNPSSVPIVCVPPKEGEE